MIGEEQKMKNRQLLIMPLGDALAYQPINRTYAIRIQSALWRYEEPLKCSPLYRIKEYTFDDRTPEWGEGRLFTEGLASAMVQDFHKELDGHDTILIHCSRGKNRSPAIGIALNEIFDFGYDSEELKKKYPESNWFIYGMMLQAAEKLGMK